MVPIGDFCVVGRYVLLGFVLSGFGRFASISFFYEAFLFSLLVHRLLGVFVHVALAIGSKRGVAHHFEGSPQVGLLHQYFHKFVHCV